MSDSNGDGVIVAVPAFLAVLRVLLIVFGTALALALAVVAVFAFWIKKGLPLY